MAHKQTAVLLHACIIKQKKPAEADTTMAPYRYWQEGVPEAGDERCG